MVSTVAIFEILPFSAALVMETSMFPKPRMRVLFATPVLTDSLSVTMGLMMVQDEANVARPNTSKMILWFMILFSGY